MVKSKTTRFLISFPRSGHHMMEDILSNVFSLHKYPYSYCECYNGCNRLPCADGKLIQKNHDFKLIVGKKFGKYVVLYRKDKILQLDAWYRWNIGKRGGKYGHIAEKKSTWWVTDEYFELFFKFYHNFSSYYNLFINKWVKKKSPNILAVEYYDILNSPNEYTNKVLRHFFPERYFLEEFIQTAIRTADIRLKNQMPQEYYQKVRKKLDLHRSK